ncbi:MAG: molybdopterin cofactor-binding domain-containing protein [Burkholderiaceae bacterium]
MAFPLGAWLPFSASVPARNAARILPGPYRIARVDIEAAAFAGNAAPVNIYRGAGRPEAAMLLERLMDEAARRHHEDPLAYRRRHLVSADAMPHTTPTGEVLDSGDYAACLETAADRFGYTSARENQRQRRAAGEIVGIGVACYVEPCGQGWESARITAHADGSFTVASGSSAQGQGHETTFSTLAIEALGDLVSPETVIRVLQGDTDTCPPGIGALASRSVAIGGSAITLAAKRLAARLRADPEAPRPLTEDCIYEAPAEAWGFGCVIAQMRVDTETGAPTIESITWADDAGRIVSPTLAHGQLIGGLAQGLGQAMMERIFYDDDGQLLTGSLMDYAVPRAADMPPVQIVGVESDAAATRANALGAKGVGEAGCIGVPAALMNSAADAVSVLPEPDAAIAALGFPLTAETLWRALHAGGHLNDDARGAAQQMEQE